MAAWTRFISFPRVRAEMAPSCLAPHGGALNINGMKQVEYPKKATSKRPATAASGQKRTFTNPLNKPG